MARKKTIPDTELLAVARGVFVDRGFAASTKEIARRAGVSEGVLFQRYPTKADLFFAAMVLPPIDLREQFQERPVEGNLLAALERISFGMLDYFRSMVPVLLPVMTHPAFRFEEFARRNPDSPLVALRQELTDFFVANRAAGRTGDVDPGAAALLLIATAHSFAMFERLGAHGGRFAPDLVRRVIWCMWRGLVPWDETLGRARKV